MDKRISEIKAKVTDFKQELKKEYGDSYNIYLTLTVSRYDMDLTKYIELLKHAICEALEITEDKLLGFNRRPKYVTGRQIFCYLLRNAYPTATLVYTGRQINKHHSTVLYVSKKAADFIKINDKQFMLHYNKVTELIQEKLEE